MRINFSPATKLAIRERATSPVTKTAYCEQCGAACPTRNDYDIDHVVAEGVRPRGGYRALTAKDGKLLCLKCHDEKTRRDLKDIARAKRLEAKHFVSGVGMPEIARRFGLK